MDYSDIIDRQNAAMHFQVRQWSKVKLAKLQSKLKELGIESALEYGEGHDYLKILPTFDDAVLEKL